MKFKRLGILKLKKIFYRKKTSVTLRDVDIEKVLVSVKIPFGDENINTLLVTYIMIIKLSHYMQCFLKQALT